MDERYRILVVDDDAVDRAVVRRAMRTAGLDVEVCEAADPVQAVLALEEQAFDCILLDFRLPRVDGLQLLREIRAKGNVTPVVMLTGQGDDQTAVEIMKAGASDYIAKSALSPARIAQSIRQAVRFARAERTALEASAALELSERRYRFLADSIPQVVWTARPDGELDYVNVRWTELTGLALEDSRGPAGAPAMHPDDAPRAVALFQTCIATAATYETEIRLLRARDGAYRWHLARAVPLVDPDGRVQRWFGTSTDIDDHKQAAAALERERAKVEDANRAKDVFLATVSHELRTPLNAILGWVRMLRGGTLPEEKRARALETIERNARAQVHLVDDLLDVSRIISGKVRLDLGPVDLRTLVESAVDAVKPTADAKRITLHHTIDAVAATAMGDPGRLQQVVANLLTNAVKFTPAGGEVSVTMARAGALAEITVSDSGQGIEPEFLPYVFEPFRQADATLSRAHGGLGLGLAIVRHLVQLHGGAIEARSEGAGKGAEFIVRLPLSSTRADGQRDFVVVGSEAPLAQASFEQPPGLTGLRVLIVEDEPDARDLVAHVLSQCGAHVTAVGSAAEALTAIEAAPPDVVVSDIGMPGETGYDLIRKVRELPADKGGRTPAIALTAFARSEDRTRALRAGFDTHVPKPVEPAELVIVIANLVGSRQRG